ncbi:MAG TPA: 4Fe-4S binding protein [Bacteroidales bacterium]|jgi:polyferredoxin|nr:4Fe-4S binding protein [Bacteroidales bacterium]
MMTGPESKNAKIKLPAIVFIVTFSLLAFVQVKVERPMILAERFLQGSGWIEILFIALYGAFVAWKMQVPSNVPYYRKVTWTIFSVVFFSQLIIGLSGAEKFLMTGKLHLPIPMMILGGPLYRGELSVMTILFLSTVVLTGPAWCSHFCYFGAFDNLAAQGKTSRGVLRHKTAIKSTVILLVISMALLLRWMKVTALTSTLVAVAFGLTGISVMIFFSYRKKKMVHCSLYCPIGTIVNVTKHVNPFRMYIDKSCTLCMNCTRFCKYDALDVASIKAGKPAIGCTLCGDCLAGCHHDSIKYKFLKLKPESARNLYLILTISLHATCLALARI